jgi:hypothetical protein
MNVLTLAYMPHLYILVMRYCNTRLFNTYANLSGALVVWWCIDTPKY